MNKKILIIVDAQYGFMEGGKLPVDGATEKMNNGVQYLDAHCEEYDAIFLTADWHPITHCSFKENGGIWDAHCTQHTHDAAIYEPILEVLNKHKIDYKILTKGCDEDHEEYSVFKNKKSCDYLIGVNKYLDVDTVDFFGIAYDYCLKDSAIDSKKVFMNSTIRVLKDFCPAIEDPNETTKVLEDNNIIVM